MAGSAYYLLQHPEVIEEAKTELKERLFNEKYECLIPKEIKPHILK